MRTNDSPDHAGPHRGYFGLAGTSSIGSSRRLDGDADLVEHHFPAGLFPVVRQVPLRLAPSTPKTMCASLSWPCTLTTDHGQAVSLTGARARERLPHSCRQARTLPHAPWTD